MRLTIWVGVDRRWAYGMDLEKFECAGTAHNAKAFVPCTCPLCLIELGLDVVTVILAFVREDSTGVLPGSDYAAGVDTLSVIFTPTDLIDYTVATATTQITVNPAPTVYNVAADFENGYTAGTNPNGVWSYGWSAGFTSPITLYDQTAQNGVNGPNAQYWLSFTVDIGTSPAAEYNNGPAYADGNIDFLANDFVLVAGIGGQYADVVFTAPSTGSYTLAATFRGDQNGINTAWRRIPPRSLPEA